MPILWDTFFCNVQVCKNLDAGDQWLMYISLNRYIFHDHTVDTHPDFRFIFKRFDVNITGTALDPAVDQTVQQMNHRSFIACLGKVRNGQFLYGSGGESHIGLTGCLPGIDLGKIISNCLMKRLFLTQQDLKLAAGLLAHFFQSKIIQWVVGYQRHHFLFHFHRKQVVFLCQFLFDQSYRFQIHLQLCYIDDLQMQSVRQSFQHLFFRDKSKLHQNLSHSFVPVFFLIDQCLTHLFFCYISFFCQDFPDSKICSHLLSPLHDSCRRRYILPEYM